jgi:hypothetical protein
MRLEPGEIVEFESSFDIVIIPVHASVDIFVLLLSETLIMKHASIHLRMCSW